MTHDEILERIRATKKAMNWTNADISTRSGVSQSTVAQLFRGNNINLFNLIDILESMGLEINII